MPLLTQQNLHTTGEYGIWDIQESEEFFRNHLQLTDIELQQINRIKGAGQRLEWLASRYLVHVMSGRKLRGALIKDEFGKPHLEHSSFQISISHSHSMAAAIAAPILVGIDLQKIVSKIERIAHKYMREEEAESVKLESRLEHLHVYWGAKEALYKAYGRKELDFRTHILIEPFEYNLNIGKTVGRVEKHNFYISFDLYYQMLGDFMLVYALEHQ